MSAFLNRLMSNTSRHVAPQLDDLDPCAFGDVCITCERCGQYHSIYVACAFHTCGDCGSSLTLVRPGKYQCDYCEAAMAAQMSSVVSGWQDEVVAMRHTFADVCPQCGRRVSMAAHLCDMGSGGTSPVVGCAFGGGRSDELPEIPLEQAVQVCHDISAKINAWACECEAQGARKCGGCE